jgi:hypothetical protein
MPVDLRPVIPRTLTAGLELKASRLNTLWEEVAKTAVNNSLDIPEDLQLGPNKLKVFSTHLKPTDLGGPVNSFVEIAGTRFIVLNHIKSGSFGMVARCLNESTGQPVILKHILCEESGDQNDALREVIAQIVVNKSEPNFSPAITHIAVKDKVLFIIMEYIKGKDVESSIKGKSTDNERALLIKQSLTSLAKMTQTLFGRYNFIHGDMKPDNLFHTDSGEIILIDFGFAKLQVDGVEIICTPQYAYGSNPTRDLSMLAFYYYSYLGLQNHPMLKPMFEAFLKPGTCNTSDASWRGEIREHPTHSLDADGGHVSDGSRIIGMNNQIWWDGADWVDSYSVFSKHVNIQMLPERVLDVIDALDTGRPIPPIGSASASSAPPPPVVVAPPVVAPPVVAPIGAPIVNGQVVHVVGPRVRLVPAVAPQVRLVPAVAPQVRLVPAVAPSNSTESVSINSNLSNAPNGRPYGGYRKKQSRHRKRTHKNISLQTRAKPQVKVTRLSRRHKKRTIKKKHVSRNTHNRSKRLQRH